MIEIKVLTASFLLVLEVMSLMHSRIKGKRSPRYGLIASALILDISEITFRMAETNVDVAFSPFSFLIRHKRIEVE